MFPNSGRGPLAEYASDTYSQFGEDGIIAEVLNRIEARTTLDRWCVEVGAWDGVHLSNTARLIREDDYCGVLVEGDPQRALALNSAHPRRKVIGIHAMVGAEGTGSLNAILPRTVLPREFDLLSIDIDGNDFHVWRAMTHFEPKVVVIEFNPTVPNSVIWVQENEVGLRQGCSPAALVELGHHKGYQPVATTATNLIFVRNDLAAAVVGPTPLMLDDVRDDTEVRVYIFAGYDGTIHTSRPMAVPWLGHLEIPSSKLQSLPRTLRHFYGGGGGWPWVRYGLAMAWVNPKAATRRVFDRASRR